MLGLPSISQLFQKTRAPGEDKDFAQANANRDITDDVIESDFIPYACHFNENTLLTKNGELLQTIKITGFDFETSERQGHNLRDALRSAIKSHIDSDKFAIWLHTIRRISDLQPRGEYPENFSQIIAQHWNEEKRWNRRFVNELFISVAYEGESAEMLNFPNFLRSAAPWIDQPLREGYLEDSHATLDNVCSRIAESLAEFGARKLTLFQENGIYYSEPLRFLGKIINLQEEEFEVPEEDISTLLPKHEITFGFNAMEVRSQSGYRRFGSVLTIKEYKELSPEVMDQFLQIPQEFIVSQCIDFINSKEAIENYQYQDNIFKISEDEPLAHASGLTDVLQSDTGSLADFGEQQLTIFLINDSFHGLERGIANAIRALASMGIIAIREDLRLAECYWSQLPANFEFISRLKPINTSRVGGFSSLHNFPSGKTSGSKWGPPVTLLHTTAHSPYFFNFHEGDQGHTLIVGGADFNPDFLLNFLLCMSQKFSGKTWIFDNDNRAAPLVTSLGGTYFDTMREVDCNPFLFPDSEEQRTFLKSWIGSLFSQDLSTFEITDVLLENTIAHAYTLPEEERTLDTILNHLKTQAPALPAITFNAQVSGGVSSKMAHGKNSLVHQTIGLNQSPFDNSDIADAMRLYWMRAIELSADGTPGIIVIRHSERWIESLNTGTHIASWLETLTNKNIIVILVIDALNDVGREPIYYADILPLLTNHFFLPGQHLYSAYKNIFKLKKQQRRIVKLMQEDRQHFLLLRDKEMIIGEMTFPKYYKEIQPILSPTKENIAVFRSCDTQDSTWLERYVQGKYKHVA